MPAECGESLPEIGKLADGREPKEEIEIERPAEIGAELSGFTIGTATKQRSGLRNKVRADSQQWCGPGP